MTSANGAACAKAAAAAPCAPFCYADTHRLMETSKARLQEWSEGTGWASIFASIQTETVTEGHFRAIDDHLLVVPLNKRLRFAGRIADRRDVKFVAPGSLTLTPRGADLNIRISSDQGRYDTIYIYIRHELVKEVAAELSDGHDDGMILPVIGVPDPVIKSIAFEVAHILRGPRLGDKLYVEMLSRAIAARLLRNTGTRQRAVARPGRLSAAQLDRAVQYIEAHLDNNLSIADIAAAAGVDKRRLSNGFKDATSFTPYDFVMRARVDWAKQLLLGTRLALTDVALTCGFSDQAHMTRIIHRVVGSTPAAMRRGR